LGYEMTADQAGALFLKEKQKYKDEY
jgi:hypothetical protein